MKVEECRKCAFYERRIWTQYYEPLNYHPIGVNHVYGFCKKYKKRCLSVKKCEEVETK